MSADLLAEFDSFYQSPQDGNNGGQNQSQAQQQGQTPRQSQTVTPQGGGGFEFPAFGQGPAVHQGQAFNQGFASSQNQPQDDIWGDFGSVSGQGPAPAQTQGRDTAEDDDGWGEFEVAEPEAEASRPPPASSPFQAQAQALPAAAPVPTPNPAPVPRSAAPPDPVARNRIVRASTMDIMTNSLIDIDVAPKPTPQPSWVTQEKPPSKPKDPNILFDADDIDDVEEDDFGDFETFDPPQQPAIPSQPSKPSPQPPSMDLLSLGDPPAPTPVASTGGVQKKAPGLVLGNLNYSAGSSPYPNAPKSPSFQDRNPFPGLAVAAPKAEALKKEERMDSPSPVTAWPSFDDHKVAKDEDWPAFEDFPPDDASRDAKTKPVNQTDSWDWDVQDSGPPGDTGDDNEPPPTNIPPPSILMSILPERLNLSNNALFKPVAGQTASIKKKIMSNPKTVDFLRSYLLMATVAARILAGRKLRWHRDKFLAQGMAISAAGAKGMKLAGVDKAQASREDREAADVIAVWREHVGRLRSAVAAANAAVPPGASSGNPLRVPEIGEQMHVTTAKVVPTAPRPCVICGLKRDERVGKVDFEVEDSFGEWWVEHWGHRACRNFWKEHEKQLRQR